LFLGAASAVSLACSSSTPMDMYYGTDAGVGFDAPAIDRGLGGSGGSGGDSDAGGGTGGAGGASDASGSGGSAGTAGDDAGSNGTGGTSQ
jgi:hypothetical protein